MKIVLKAKKHAALLNYKHGYGYKHYSFLKKLCQAEIYEVHEATKRWEGQEVMEEKVTKLIIIDKSSVVIPELVIWVNKLISEGLVVTNGAKEEVLYLKVYDNTSIEVVYQSKSVVVTVKEFLKFFTFTDDIYRGTVI